MLHYPSETTLFLLGAFIGIWLAVLVARRQAVPGKSVFFWLSLDAAVWSLFCAFELMAVSAEAKILWGKFEYIGVTTVPVLWYMFALDYTHLRSWVNFRGRNLIWLVPVVTLLLAFTNERHGLLWSEIQPISSEPGANLIYGRGGWFWVNAAFCYLLVVAGSLRLLWQAARSTSIYRRQGYALLVSAAIPLASNLIYLTGNSPIQGVDITPIGFSVAGVILAWGLFRYQLFDLVPVARYTLVENMMDGVLVLDANQRVIDANPSAQRLLQSDLPSFIGLAVDAIFPGWEKISAELCVEPITSAAIIAETEINIHERRYLDVQCLQLPVYGLGKPGKLLILRDITKRKMAEQRLQMQGKALETAANAIMITDVTGDIVWVNPAFSALSGYTAEEALGKNPRDLVKSDEQDQAFFQNMWETILAGKVWQGEIVNRRKDGSLYTEEQTITPLFDDDGVSIRNFISIKQDISERKHLEQMQDQLTHTMVHDLRNPLTNINLALEIMGKNPARLPEGDLDMLEVARQNTQRMLGLVNSILSVSRLENKKMPLHFQAFNIFNLAKEVIERQVSQAAQKNLRMANQISPTLPLVWGDTALTTQVIENLVGNAVKFTPTDGEVRLDAQFTGDPPMMQLAVSDTGPGISDELRTHLFQKFVTGRVKGSGSGLGLAFCRLAVEAQGGSIWADSQEGEGTTFRFTLPIALGDEESPDDTVS